MKYCSEEFVNRISLKDIESQLPHFNGFNFACFSGALVSIAFMLST